MTCEQTHLDGAYVLGALSPAERLQFERHLAGCDDCSRAVREIAGLPGLLAQVDPADLDPSDTPPLPSSLLPRLVRDVRRSQRRRMAGVAAVAAAVAATAAAVTVGSLAASPPLSPGAPGAPGPSGTPTASSTVPALAMEAVGSSPVAAEVRVAGVAWGTRLDLTCSYAMSGSHGSTGPTGSAFPHYPDERGPEYALVVRTRSGATEQVATWHALPGRTMRVSAATATDRSDITSVEMRTMDGTVVLRRSV